MTTTEQRTNPFKGQAKADGGDFKTEIPSEDTHDARIIGLVDLGTHMESFKGEAPKAQRKCLLVFELDEEMTGTRGVNHVVGVEYTLSYHEKASLRKLAETILNDGQKYKGDVDYGELLGQPCAVQVSHTVKQTDNGERRYVKVGAISAVNKKKRESHFKAKRPQVVWCVGDDLSDLPDFLPRIWGEKVEDKIGRCHEVKGQPAAEADDGGGIPPGFETPF